jgi:hypothetical protein
VKDPGLEVGAYGDEVTLLQQQLRKAGYDVPASETSRRFFGPGTRTAVMRYQQDRHLPVSGHADPATLASLGAVFSAPPPRPADYQIPDQLDEKALAAALMTRLAGTPADGSPPAPAPAARPVIWVDKGDEVLVHLDSISTRIAGQRLLVSVDLETDQTGRTPLVVAFALGPGDGAGLLAATDELPRGNGMLAARWGPTVQAAAWASLLMLAQDHASERGTAPLGLALAGGQLHLQAGPALRVA